MRSLNLISKDPAVRSNNKRALWIHFVLSFVGVATFFMLSSLSLLNYLVVIIPVFLEQEQILMVPLYLTLVVGAFIYVFCGYRFLEPTRDSTALSVVWLAFVTMAASLLSMIVLVISDFGRIVAVEGSYILITLIFNTIGSGVITLFGVIGLTPHLFDYPQNPLTYLVPALLPSGLLYLGLRLKMWRQGKYVALPNRVEEGF